MADLQKLENALKNAHRAGDMQAARAIANELKRHRQITRGEAAVRSGAQGLTAGWLDEIEGAQTARADVWRRIHEAAQQGPEAVMAAGRDRQAFEEARKRGTQEARERLALGRERHPVTSGVSEVGGAVVSGALVPAGAAARGAGMGTRAFQGAMGGAGYGAFYGGGTAEGGVIDRAPDALLGAGIGAAGGAAAVPAIAAAGRAVELGGRAVQRVTGKARGAVDPAGEAARRVEAAIQRDRALGGPALDEAGFRMADAQGQPVRVIDTGGETTRALARSAANQSPEARAVLEDAIADRFEGQGERIAGFIRRFAGKTDAGATREALREAARKANRPAYAKAYRAGAESVYSEELERLAGSPAITKAMREAAETGRDYAIRDGFGAFNPGATITQAGRVVFRRGAGGTPVYPNLQFWDYTYRNLRDAGRAAARAGRTEESARLTGLAIDLRRELDRLVPEFGEARAGAAKFFGAEDALEAGQRFVTSNLPIAEARRAVAKLKRAERQLFEEGFAESLIEKIDRTGYNRDVVRAIWGSKQARDRINLVLGPKRSRELEVFLHVESVIDKARKAITGNSTTARQLAELGLAGNLTTAGAGGVGYVSLTGSMDPQGIAMAMFAASVARRGARGARQLSEGVDRRIAERVGVLLASSDPAEVQRGVRIVANNPKLLNGLRNFELPIGFGGANIAVEGQAPERQPLQITVTPE